MNEWHVRDTSRKIRAVIKSRMEKGIRHNGDIAYGYKKSLEDKNKIEIDEESAAIVKRIFQMVIEGNGATEIARILKSEKITTPSYHKGHLGKSRSSVPYNWTESSVVLILKRPEYMGHTILGKTYTESYKTKKIIKKDEKDWYIFENTIPAIIDEETWHNVQKLRTTKRVIPRIRRAPSRLTGLLFCEDCGRKMYFHTNVTDGKEYSMHSCSTYTKDSSLCTRHSIKLQNSEKMILLAIQRLNWYAIEYTEEFLAELKKQSNSKHEETISQMKSNLQKFKKRYEEVDQLITNLYEESVINGLSETRYKKLLEKYEKEETTLGISIEKLEEKIDTLNAENLNSESFLNLTKRYINFSELTTPMLNEFVDKVLVHEKVGNGSTATQQLDIYFKFIGNFQVPSNIISPAEVEEQEKLKKELEQKEQRTKELLRLSRERSNLKQKEFRKRIYKGEATEEELQKYYKKLERNRELNRIRRENGNPRIRGISIFVKKIKEGIPLTEEEMAKYELEKRKLAEKSRKRRARIKASMPPPPPKVLSLRKIREKRKNGIQLTEEEQAKFSEYTERQKIVRQQRTEAEKLAKEKLAS
jgi:hypothetical protein